MNVQFFCPVQNEQGSVKNNRRHSEKTEARILSAAERIFAEKGLKGSRISEIAELAVRVQRRRLDASAAEIESDGEP